MSVVLGSAINSPKLQKGQIPEKYTRHNVLELRVSGRDAKEK